MSTDLIKIATFATPPEAELARNALALEGIESYLEGDTFVGWAWHLSDAVGGVKLLVGSDDTQRAIEILGPPQSADDRASHSSAEATTVAPGPDDIEEDALSPTAVGDATARRAWRAAVLGLILLPPLLNVYSIWLLLEVVLNHRPLSQKGHRCFLGAMLVDVLLLALVAWLIMNHN